MRAEIALVCTIILLPAVRAAATPYLVAYEGDVYPEQAGWERNISAGGADRSLDNGIFTLWALDDNMISDQYIYDMQEQLNPDPGEYFFAEWRMRLLPESGSSDVGIALRTDGAERQFSAYYAVNGFGASGDGGGVVWIDATQFRTYRLESYNMVDYTIWVDGQWGWDGFFLPGACRHHLWSSATAPSGPHRLPNGTTSASA